LTSVKSPSCFGPAKVPRRDRFEQTAGQRLDGRARSGDWAGDGPAWAKVAPSSATARHPGSRKGLLFRLLSDCDGRNL
jgi:hypothetical protein